MVLAPPSPTKSPKEVEYVAIKRRGFRDALGEVPPSIAERKRANVAACLAHAVLSTYEMIAYAIIHSQYTIFIVHTAMHLVGDERNASGDQRVSISCVKWTACARHAATLALVVFHVRNSLLPQNRAPRLTTYLPCEYVGLGGPRAVGTSNRTTGTALRQRHPKQPLGMTCPTMTRLCPHDQPRKRGDPIRGAWAWSSTSAVPVPLEKSLRCGIVGDRRPSSKT